MNEPLTSTKRGKKTKLAAAFLSVVIAATCFTTACQPVAATPTPSQSKASSPSAAIQASEPSQKPKASYDAPPSYQSTFQANDEKVTINVDAPITLPNATEYSVYEITPGEMTADFVKKAANILMEGKPLTAPRTAITKAELQQQINTIQQILADPANSNIEGMVSPDPNIVATTTQLLQSSLNRYQELYATAPETDTPGAAAMQFTFWENHYETVMEDGTTVFTKYEIEDENGNPIQVNQYNLEAAAELASGYHGFFLANKSTGDQKYNNIYFHKGMFLATDGKIVYQNYDIPNPPCTITQDQAYQMAQNLLDQLGISGLYLYSCVPAGSPYFQMDDRSGNIYGYQVSFRRSYGGMPVISIRGYTNADGIQVSQDEIITIHISNDQIDLFSWQNPVKEIKTVEQNVTLLPFDEITKIFQKEMAAQMDTKQLTGYLIGEPNYSQMLSNMQSGQVNITRIELGLVSVSVPGQPGVCRLIPVWKFYGTDQFTHNANGTPETVIDYPRFGNLSYLTINAMDGSIIDNYA